MTHNLIVRGFDNQVHSKLGEVANQRGVSINSIIKDAVDKWLKEAAITSSKEALSNNLFR